MSNPPKRRRRNKNVLLEGSLEAARAVTPKEITRTSKTGKIVTETILVPLVPLDRNAEPSTSSIPATENYMNVDTFEVQVEDEYNYRTQKPKACSFTG